MTTFEFSFKEGDTPKFSLKWPPLTHTSPLFSLKIRFEHGTLSESVSGTTYISAKFPLHLFPISSLSFFSPTVLVAMIVVTAKQWLSPSHSLSDCGLLKTLSHKNTENIDEKQERTFWGGEPYNPRVPWVRGCCWAHSRRKERGSPASSTVDMVVQ